MKLDRKLWLDTDGNVVEDGDPAAAFLLGTAGKEIPDAEAERLGLKPSKKTAAKAEEPAPEQEPAEAKQADAPANKARKKTANKSK